MNFPFNYEDLPQKDAIDAYVKTGRPVGDFLYAVLTNDLQGANSHADEMNLTMIPVYCRYLYNECPSSCFGSPEIYEAWRRKGGLEGMEG